MIWLWYTTTQPFVRAADNVATPPIPVEPSRLEADVRALSERYFPRDSTSLENLEAAASFIETTASKAGARITSQSFDVPGAKGPFRNVVASFGRADEAAERIVVGAHYDACGAHPAADDNASGVAGLLELARLLGASRTALDALPVRIDLVAYSTEEPPYFATPHMGSVHHAQSLANKGVRVRAMLALEMIGYFSDAEDSQHYPSIAVRPFYPSRGNFIALVGRDDDAAIARTVKSAMLGTRAIPTYSMTGPFVLPGVDWSDHRSYWSAGYPALMVTDTAFLRNQAYHTDGDRPETLDYARMAAVVQGVHAAVLALAR
ncbi:hypothetical protein AKJ09_09887 [Labilithrix luteola]|uniref:Peptidase M28 domain-containing protein n=1 Tax=Labilithrix luteola TaxID=1391654 RepID=A0A0K1QBV9_9BACT|nr:hypothetical protein AKJ09_09887 [Labilithrix luteola]